MRVFNRTINLTAIPNKLVSILGATVGIMAACKKPLNVLKHYVTKTPASYFELRNGFKIFLSSNPNDVATFVVIFCKGEYGSLKRKQTVIDIGGNIGIFALYALYRGAAQVHSFEPNIESYQTICKNIQANNLGNRWKAYNYGVAAKSGGHIYIPKTSSPTNVAVADAADSARFDKIPTISINDFVKQQRIQHIDLMKIDCEGAEYDIIPAFDIEVSSMTQEIKMEFHQGDDSLTNWLNKHGFSITKTEYFTANKQLGYIFAVKLSAII